MNIKGTMTVTLTLPDLFSNKDVDLSKGEEIELRDIKDVKGKMAYFVYGKQGHCCLVFTHGLLEKTTSIRL